MLRRIIDVTEIFLLIPQAVGSPPRSINESIEGDIAISWPSPWIQLSSRAESGTKILVQDLGCKLRNQGERMDRGTEKGEKPVVHVKISGLSLWHLGLKSAQFTRRCRIHIVALLTVSNLGHSSTYSTLHQLTINPGALTSQNWLDLNWALPHEESL